MIHQSISTIFAALTISFSVTTRSASAGDELPPLQVGEHRFERRELSNGLIAIAAFEDEPTVSVFMVIGTGRRFESPLTNGLAHLTEHAMYTGTAKTPAGRHDARILELGGESNAFTRDDYTLFYDHRVPAGDLDEVLAMEADRLRSLVFDEAALKHEQERLSAEEAHTFTAEMARDELLESCVYRAHPYGSGLLDGGGHTLAPGLSIAQVRAFYDAHYQPNRTAVVVAGNVDPRSTLGSIERTFGALERGPDRPVLPREPEALMRSVHHLRWPLSQDRVETVWIVPELGDPSRAPLQVLARLLSRCTLSDGSPLEASLGSRADEELFRVAATGPLAAAELEELVKELSQGPWNAQEIEEVKQLLRDDFSTLSLRGRPYFSLAGLVGVYSVLGQATCLESHTACIDRVDARAFREVVEKHLSPDRRHVVHFHAEQKPKSPLPQDPKALVSEAQNAEASGDLERAADAYTMLLALNPNRMNTVIYLASRGQVRVKQKQYELAIDDYERALAVVDYPAVRDLLEEAKKLRERASAEDDSLGLRTVPRDGGQNAPTAASTVEQPPASGSGKGERVAVEADAQAQADAAAAAKREAAALTAAEKEDAALEADSPQAYLEKLQEQLPEVTREIEQWRGLSFLTSVQFELATKSDSSLGGWYEPRTQRLVVVGRNTERFRRGALLHECFHALQDQHFDLERLREEAGPDEDAQRALTALIEGEAMLAVAEIMDYDFEQHARLPESGDIDPERFEKVFHYGAGMRFVRTLRDRAGQSSVATLFRSPPRSTAEILHPDLYPRPQPPPIDTPVPGKTLSDTHKGEYELLWWLSRCEATRARAADLAALLVMDRHREVEQDGKKLMIWDIRFADEATARRFVEESMPALPSGSPAQIQGPEVRLRIDP